jgi:Domain of unknown function (DUF4209)
MSESQNHQPKNVFEGSIDDVALTPIEAGLAGAVAPACDNYQTSLSQAASREIDAGNVAAGNVYRFLSRLCSFYPTYGNRESPYRAMRIWKDGSRSCSPVDLSDLDLDCVKKIFELTSDPTLKARLGDILWVCRKDHKAAVMAADCFVASGTRLIHSPQWTEAMTEFTRALQLAMILGRNKPLWQTISTTIQQIALEVPDSDTSFKVCQIMRVLLDAGAGTASQFIGRAGARAEAAATNGDHNMAEAYWEIEAQWRKASKDEEGTRIAQLNAAESKVQQAEALIPKPESGNLAAAALYAQAVDALRKAGATQERVTLAKARLLECQKRSMGEMKEIPYDIDISPLIKSAEDRVTCVTFAEAVRRFVLGYPLTDPAKLRQEVLDSVDQHPFSHLFGASFVDRDGLTKARSKGLHNVEEDDRETEIMAKMFQHAAQFNWNIRAQGYIEPCRVKIWNMHHPTCTDMTYLIQANPFIPDGHEAIFARGLLAGFEGDFLMASHFLTPQIENSIRYVLKQQGVDISNLMSDLTQPVKLLGPLFDEPATTKIFGEATVFELRGFLIEKTGFDFRNQVAHGFVTAAECHSVPAVNIWWLVLRLCVTGYLLTQNIPQEST